MTSVDVGQFGATSDLLEADAAANVPVRPAIAAFAAASNPRDEAFMTLLFSMSDTRKRIIILSLLSFLAMC